MNQQKLYPLLFITVLLVAALSCNLPSNAPASQSNPSSTSLAPIVPPAPESSSAAPAAAITHLMKPSESASASGKLVYDVDSSGTGSEGRAPYGDSYSINRFERPFLQNMTYVPDLDIATYTVSSDSHFWYVSIALTGTDPNDTLGINYGVELDVDHDGFGDYIIWTHPPYTTNWDTRSEEHTSELQSPTNLVCRLLLE